MQLFKNLFTFTDALLVSGGSSAHNQEFITVHTASNIVNKYRGGDKTSVQSHPR
jgi:hypothetical protein